MDIRFLKSFVAVVEDGSIASASRRLNLTPGAVTQRLKALEHEFGTPLVVRSGRSVQPTNAGAFIIAHARKVVRDADNLRESLARRLVGCSLRIGAISSIADDIMPDLLIHLASEHPEIELTLTCGESAKLYQGVLSHNLDAAVAIGQPNQISKNCKWAPLCKQKLVLISSSAANLSSVEELLLSRPMVQYKNKDYATLSDLYLCQVGIRPRVLATLDSINAVERLVAADLGVSLVPDWVAPSAQQITRWPIDGPEHRHEVGLLWAHGSAGTKVIQALLRRLTCTLTAPNMPTPCAPASTLMAV